MSREVTRAPSKIKGICAAILAGGESRRFGQDKALALLDNKPLIRHVLEPLQCLFEATTLIVNQPEAYECFDVDIASDIVRGPGALGGLLTALVHAEVNHCFVVACDMPLLNISVIRKILGQRCNMDVRVPVWNQEPQPLHALYSKRCIPFIEKRIQQGDFRIVDFYQDVAVQPVPEDVWRESEQDCLSFFNVNTRKEFAKAEQLFKSRQYRLEREP